MTQHTDEITDEIEDHPKLEYYDHVHTKNDSHDVVAASPNQTVEPGTPLVCVSWSDAEEQYAVFSGVAEEPSIPGRKGYDVTTIDGTYDDLALAVDGAAAVLILKEGVAEAQEGDD